MRARWLWGLAALALAGGAVAVASGPIALRVMRAGALRNVSADLASSFTTVCSVIRIGQSCP